VSECNLNYMFSNTGFILKIGDVETDDQVGISFDICESEYAETTGTIQFRVGPYNYPWVSYSDEIHRGGFHDFFLSSKKGYYTLEVQLTGENSGDAICFKSM
jgi:hypothetical protein